MKDDSGDLVNESIIRDGIDVGKFGLTMVGIEYETPLGRIDILTTDETGAYVPIEIKTGVATDSAVGQMLGYMKATKAGRGIIVASDFSDRVTAVCGDLNIELVAHGVGVVMPELTTMSLTKGVRDRLRAFGMKGETYDDILIRLMRNYRDPNELRMDENILEQICV
jgi:Holliday junction resolvase-like predicted endonuclease